MESAVKHRDRTKAVSERFDDVWCVIDIEAPEPHGGFRQAVAFAEQKGVRLAISNPCFELFLLLHFGDEHTYLTSESACRKLEACDCDYSMKGKAFDYAAVASLQEIAHERARTLAARTVGESDVIRRNPWTSVHELIDELRRASES